jgi:hypothetical protein
MSQQGHTNWKKVLGIILLIVTPLRLFVKPATPRDIGYDLVLVIWWAFVIWLLRAGFMESKQENSK